jgi:hypothetical protein
MGVQNNMIEIERGNKITFHYTNWKGEHAIRRVQVASLWYGTSEYHIGEQFFITAIDLDKKDMRCFAVKDMTHVERIY